MTTLTVDVEDSLAVLAAYARLARGAGVPAEAWAKFTYEEQTRLRELLNAIGLCIAGPDDAGVRAFADPRD